MLFTTMGESIAVVQVFFSHSLLENRMLFWIGYQMIPFTSCPTSTTTLLQISLTIGTSLTTAIRSDRYVSTFVFNHPPYQVLQRMPSYCRISTYPLAQNSLVYSILLFIISFLLEYTSTTLLAKQYELRFIFIFLLFIL